MKRKLLLLVISMLLVTGCGKTKNLQCTLEQKAQGATTTSVMNINFNGNKAKDITLDISIDYTDEYASYADTFKQTLESQRSSLEKVGYKVEITSKGNSQKLKATGTGDSLDSSEATGSYDATKKSLENSGYTCK